MKLLSQELINKFAAVGIQGKVIDPLVIAKYINPNGDGTWYATEYYPEERMFFGFISIFHDWSDEWGYFSLDYLESFRGALGLGLMRDIYFETQPISRARLLA